MTYGPPPEPNASAPQSDAAVPGPNVASSAPTPPQGPMPPHPYPQQPWIIHNGPGWPGGPPPVDRPKGFGLAVAAVILGLLGCVLPFLPIDMTGVRPYVAWPFGLAGLVLAILGYTGHRRGKPLALAGAILSGLALAVGLVMVAAHANV